MSDTLTNLGPRQRIVVQKDWRKLFSQETLEEAKKPEQREYLRGFQTLWYSGVMAYYYYSRTRYYQVQCAGEPNSIDSDWQPSYFRCTCGRKGCLHAAVLMYYWESKHGPWMIKESDYVYAQRLEKIDCLTEQARRNAMYQQLGSNVVPALSYFSQKPALTGLVFYDLPQSLQSYKTNAYYTTRADEVIAGKAIQRPSFTQSNERGKRTLTLTAYVNDKKATGSYTVRITGNTIHASGTVSLGNYAYPVLSIAFPSDPHILNEYELVLYSLVWDYLAKQKNVDQTDDAARSFFQSLERIERDLDKPVQQQAAQKEANLCLMPRIIMEEGEAKLSFKVGYQGARLYVLRNLPEFYSAYTEGRTFPLSKKESLDFSKSTFCEDSQPWIAYIQRHVRSIGDFNAQLEKKSYYAPTLTITNSQTLTGTTLDQFYDLGDGKICEFTDKDNNIKDASLKIGHTAMHFSLLLDRLGDARETFAGIAVSGLVPVLIKGASANYIFTSKYLSRITPQEQKILNPYTHVADATGYFRFQVGLDHLADFYYHVLPGLLDNPCVDLTDHCGDEPHAYLPPEADFKFYVDYDNELLSLHGTVSYNDTSFPLVQKPTTKKDVYRDIGQEERVVHAVKGYFPDFDEDKNEFTAAGNDDALYDFLEHGIQVLSKYGEVHGTNAFQRQKVRPTPAVQVGVSVESGVMNLSVSSKDMTPDELLAVLDSYRRKKRYHHLKSGDFVDLSQTDAFQQLDDLLADMDLDYDEVIKKNAHLPLYRALYLDKALEEHEALIDARDKTYRALIKNFKTIKDSDYEVPQSLSETLRPYQTYGHKWLRTLETAGFGGILADDMGLGKTIQMISIILSAKEEGRLTHPALIICPASLAFNWNEEFSRFAPSLSVTTLTGGLGQRRELFSVLRESQGEPSLEDPAKGNVKAEAIDVEVVTTQEGVEVITNPDSGLQELEAPTARRGRKKKETVDISKPYDVYITTYDLVKRDVSQYDGLQFYLMVLDEAQFIKNQRAAVSRTVKVIKAQHRFALTGTPIENRLSELWSIFDYLMPGFLYRSEEFIRKYETAITKEKNEEVATKLKKTVSPFILRRKKEDVLKDLPAKLEEVRYARFDEEQQILYDAQVTHMRTLLEAGTTQENRLVVFSELTKIREICCDPTLLFDNYTGSSAKREACMDLIRSAIDGGHRMLVFSQFVNMLSLLEEDLKKEGIEWYKIIGSTPKEKRISLVHAFNEGTVPVFLISLKAGGTGLNLIGADMVIHYDPWWNQAVQNQATDRAHRIGQTKQVTVYKLIAKGTIEEKILELQEAKKDLAEAVLEGSQDSLFTLSPEELLELLS